MIVDWPNMLLLSNWSYMLLNAGLYVFANILCVSAALAFSKSTVILMSLQTFMVFVAALYATGLIVSLPNLNPYIVPRYSTEAISSLV